MSISGDQRTFLNSICMLVFEILTFQKCVIGEIWLGGDFVRANLMVPGRTYIYIHIYMRNHFGSFFVVYMAELGWSVCSGLVRLGQYLVGAVGSQLNGRVPIGPRARWGRPGWARGGRPRELGVTIARGPMSASGDQRTIAGEPVSISGDQRTISGGPLSISGDQRTIFRGPRSISRDLGPSLEGLRQYLEISGPFNQHFYAGF